LRGVADALVMVFDGRWYIILCASLAGEARQSVLNLAAYHVRIGRCGGIKIEPLSRVA
jgi:hypothetical protein